MIEVFYVFLLFFRSAATGRPKGFVGGGHLTVEVVRLLNSTGAFCVYVGRAVSDLLFSAFSSSASWLVLGSLFFVMWTVMLFTWPLQDLAVGSVSGWHCLRFHGL